MADLKSMKMSKKEAKKMYGESIPSDVAPDSGPKYPWGLQIDLNEESLGKLGMSIEDVTVGDEVDVTAVAMVESLRMSQHQDGSKCENITLQITKMGIK